MPKPSVYEQIVAARIAPGPFTKPSPRLWNPGLLRYKGRLWASMRYHLGPEHHGRCATCLLPIDRGTFQPTALAQHLNFPSAYGDTHFEDARLFMFGGKPHACFVSMTGYRPGVDYKCHIEYARLKLLGNRWEIEEVFWPKYGRNGGDAKEKNWAFFEADGKLHCVYQDDPVRKVIQLDGDKVVAEYESPVATWPWGHIRGGTPAIPYGDGKMLAIFHSSLPTEEPPHFVRYYAGAYVFEAKPPFRITAISSRPIMTGSEKDGHGYDPRYAEGWKPYVVFPCGIVPDGDDWLVSLGVNDWQCAVARVTPAHLHLVKPDGSDAPTRYFRTPNGSLPVRITDVNGQPQWIGWEVPRADRRGAMAPVGYFSTNDGRQAEVVADSPRAVEITEAEYSKATAKALV